MAVDDDTVTVARLEGELSDSPPALPEVGLEEIFAHWSGPGDLWAALAIVDDGGYARHWTDREIESRAHRVLLQHLESSLQQWPLRTDTWLERLPAVSVIERFDSPYVQSGVSWTRTMRRYSWPPSRFLGRQRNRAVDLLLVTTTRWALERLAKIYTSATNLFSSAGEGVARQLGAALALLDLEPIAGAEAIKPTLVDLRSMRAEGTPWSYVADVCDELRQVESSLMALSRRAIYPQPQLRGRLFHLAVLGLFLRSVRGLGHAITSRRPLGAPSVGPAYSFEYPANRQAHLWFEAAGAWKFYGHDSPYVEATQGVEGAGSPIGADLMLLLPYRKVLLVECKYSRNPQTVARGGYEQAVAYAAETWNRLAPEVVSIVVGPDEVVVSSHRTTLSVGTIVITSPSGIDTVVREFLSIPATVA